ncbi:hypothetical protein [Microbulbifer litoralis]|nr:hypothetical protein [Microbulbifer sp. GX H0434]
MRRCRILLVISGTDSHAPFDGLTPLIFSLPDGYLAGIKPE